MDELDPITTAMSGTHADTEQRSREGFRDAALDQPCALHVREGYASEAERRRVLAWLGAGLRPQRPGRLPLEYPLLFERGSSAIPLIAFVDEAPAAFCVLWPADFEMNGAVLHTGLLSLVYTDPACRGRGLAQELVRHALSLARREGLGCVMLWSDLDRLYAPLGFVRSGAESLIPLDAALLDRAIEYVRSEDDEDACLTGLTVERPEPGDWRAMADLRRSRRCRLAIEEQFSSLQSLPDMSVRVARDESGIRAFAMRGRGDDFAEVVHEWAGDALGALLCCRALVEENPLDEALFLLSPPQRCELTWAIRRCGGKVIQKPLAWFRIANAGSFADDLGRVLPEWPSFSLTEGSRDAREDPVFRILSEHGTHELAQSELLAAVFGSEHPRIHEAALAALHPVFGSELLAGLPLPFFVSGLESI